ncbi:hypothetical protein HYQ46_007384 [Verticillium longisporum]|nr:hypothetical protein HYQ44_016139 [Verticillium longisporum]KAG7143874.1 hypothetical protein HYQ46_007384 [Verticillium longisporum]
MLCETKHNSLPRRSARQDHPHHHREDQHHLGHLWVGGRLSLPESIYLSTQKIHGLAVNAQKPISTRVPLPNHK